MNCKLTSGLEDYLESIFFLQKEKGFARVKDIATSMGVRAASVTGALQSLAAKNLVNYAPYEYITLTETGESLAKKIAKRHRILKEFFCNFLCIEECIADDAACECEHALPPETYTTISALLKFLNTPRGEELQTYFKEYLEEENGILLT